jgi:hypothetical protein
MTNIVQFVLNKEKRAVKVSDREALMDALRDALYAEEDIERLANRIGVHKSTLFAIRSGRTKWPRHTTMLTLIHVLGFELWLVKN